MIASALLDPSATPARQKPAQKSAATSKAKASKRVSKPAAAMVEAVEKATAVKSRVSSKSVTRVPSWLRLPGLAAATADIRSSLPSLESATAAELVSRTKALIKLEIGFISNPEFAEAGVAKEIFAEPLPIVAVAESAVTSKKAADLPAHLSRMCEAKLLTPELESALFRRMNFLRHQANVVRATLTTAEPSAAKLALVYRLLALADWHRDRIVEANTRLVFSIVKKFINANNVFDDLLSDGIIALIRAVEKFDYDRGFRFSTYATQVVRRNAYRQVVQKQQERAKVLGGIQDLNIDVSDESRASAISETRWHELRSRLALMLGELDRREKFIIRARFSLGSHRRVHTLQALADRLGVSKERVRQLERRAMEKLRAMAGNVKLVELET